ncbi:MAG: HD domain-containing protein [Paludibacteraceae bacterium]|nr:HD domain-containing protein [Paludibacteraceae bacterium]
MNSSLKTYIETHILPQYEHFDKGHNIEHIQSVIKESLLIAKDYDVSEDMVYTIAAYHDIGIPKGRDLHHIYSGEFLLQDAHLNQWFSAEEIQTMKAAIEDHRASSKNEPRSIYGKIISEADRQLDCETIIRRTIQFSLKNFPNYTFDEHYQRIIGHIQEKYGENGYLKLWIKSKRNEKGLADIRQLLKNKSLFKQKVIELYEKQQ